MKNVQILIKSTVW